MFAQGVWQQPEIWFDHHQSVWNDMKKQKKLRWTKSRRTVAISPRCFNKLTCKSTWKLCTSAPRAKNTLNAKCHESGCHSLQLHITHGLHLPSCTAHTHSRPPLHQSHSCHHSLINPDCLTTPAPHSLTRIKAAHKHSPSAKSCFPLANILSVSLVFWFPVFTWTAYLLWPFAACPFDPACLLISSLSAACPDLALSLLLILSSLHNSCYYLWPLPVWPPLVNH